MLKGIPWDTIGPIATAVIIILAIVFWFILRWQKQTKPAAAPTNPPRTINDTHKKSLCFDHHKDIAQNQTAIKMIGDQFKAAQEQNSEQYGKLFDKLEEQGKEIIKEIHKANGNG